MATVHFCKQCISCKEKFVDVELIQAREVRPGIVTRLVFISDVCVHFLTASPTKMMA